MTYIDEYHDWQDNLGDEVFADEADSETLGTKDTDPWVPYLDN